MFGSWGPEQEKLWKPCCYLFTSNNLVSEEGRRMQDGVFREQSKTLLCPEYRFWLSERDRFFFVCFFCVCVCVLFFSSDEGN